METQNLQTQKSLKGKHITNVRFPYAKTWDKNNTYLEFECANIHFSMANAIRRIMLANVQSVGFRSEPYQNSDINIIENDTPLHNQIMAHRIAMIPINVPVPDKFNVDDYLFILKVINNTNIVKNITTEDFEIKQISTNKFLSKENVKAFFPPDAITGDYALITKLRPKYFVPFKTMSAEVISDMNKEFKSNSDSPMNLNIEAKASISSGSENSHYCPVACACYINTVDPARAEIGLKEFIDKHNENAKLLNITPMDTEALKRRFDLTERSRYFYINDKEEPTVFTFKIESVGIIPPFIIFHRAINILKDKLNFFISNLINKNENVITIENSKQLINGYNIIIQNEDDTLGNIIQSHFCLLYADYSLEKDKRKLKFVGYKRPHPLENHIILTIQAYNDNLDILINDIIKSGCSEIIMKLNQIQTEIEKTTAFVNELKFIS